MKRFAPVLLIGLALHAQVYSPRVLVKDQIDSSDLPGLVRGIYAQAHASTPREKAEAVWRFFLTDGRFVNRGRRHIYEIETNQPGRFPKHNALGEVIQGTAVSACSIVSNYRCTVAACPMRGTRVLTSFHLDKILEQLRKPRI